MSKEFSGYKYFCGRSTSSANGALYGYGGYREFNRIKQRRAWLLLGWVALNDPGHASSPPARLLVVIRKSPLSLWSPRCVIEGFLALTSPGKIRHHFTLLFYFTS
ncbi:hypothetical protein J6590_013721 [Homalodisca vitripennis]|nr:hypothetical protein J6590_013721 [Homalodisca vitripennis]